MAKKRFEVVYSQGIIENIRILVDRETGVNYLNITNADAAGLTVLLGKDGKPVITPITTDNE